MTAGRPGAILALDLSLTTGFALGHACDREPLSGVWSLPSGNQGAAFDALEHNLADAIEVHAPSLVFMEAPLVAMVQTSARLLLGLAAHVESTCWRYSVPCREETVQKIRLVATGRGHFKKGMAKAHVAEWCRNRGWSPCDDNAADALVAWQYAISEMTRRRAVA